MRDIYVCVIFLRVKIYWMFFYWSYFFNVHFSHCEVFMRQVFHVTLLPPGAFKMIAVKTLPVEARANDRPSLL